MGNSLSFSCVRKEIENHNNKTFVVVVVVVVVVLT